MLMLSLHYPCGPEGFLGIARGLWGSLLRIVQSIILIAPLVRVPVFRGVYAWMMM